MPNKRQMKRIIDYIYGEMAPKDRKDFESEFERDPELKKNVMALKSTRKSLQAWKEYDSSKRIVDSYAIISESVKAKRTVLSGMPLWSRIALAGGAFVFLLAVLNFNVSFSDNGFSIGFGLFSSHTPASMNNKVSGEVNKNNEQLLQAVRSYIAERDQKQIDEIVRLLKASEIKSNERRKLELKSVYEELANLKLNTNRYLVNANQAIQGLFQYVSDIGDQKQNPPGKSI